MAIASGVAKKLVLCAQSAQGTIAVTTDATAQYLRRVSSTLDLTKETYQSNEINSNFQITDMRHGVQSVDGSISGELSPGTYKLFQAAILKRDFTTVTTLTALTDCAAALTTTPAGTFTSATATFLQSGIKIGMIIRCTGWLTTAVNNNDHNFLVTNVTDTVLTVTPLDGASNPLVAKIAGDSIVFSIPGKVTFVPDTGHTEKWFTIEHNYSDLDLSEVFWDCKVNTASFKLPASGMATTDYGIMGLNNTDVSGASAPYFTTGTVLAASTTGSLAGVNGVLLVEGTPIALLTGLDFDISAGLSSEAVVGSNVKPFLFDGKVAVKGNMSVFFADSAFKNYFKNETEISIVGAFTTSNAKDSPFLAFSFPRVKVGGSSKDDGEKGLVQTVPFTALLNSTGGPATGATATSKFKTTMAIQDSTI